MSLCFIKKSVYSQGLVLPYLERGWDMFFLCQRKETKCLLIIKLKLNIPTSNDH